MVGYIRLIGVAVIIIGLIGMLLTNAVEVRTTDYANAPTTLLQSVWGTPFCLFGILFLLGWVAVFLTGGNSDDEDEGDDEGDD